MDVDKIMADETEKQWRVRLEQWGREDAARSKLLHEVYSERARQIEEKRTRISELKINFETEASRLAVEAASDARWSDERKAKEAERRKVYREGLLSQIEEKEAERKIAESAMLAEMKEEEKRKVALAKQLEAEQRKQELLINEMKARRVVTAPWNK